MKIQASQKVSKIVAENYKTAQVFTAHGIDFCCNGGIPLQDACEKRQVDVNQILRELNGINNAPGEVKFKDMPMDELANYIVEKHHSYVREAIPALLVYLEKICQVHGAKHPELFEITEMFKKSAADLAVHMQKEEQILFPFIRKLASSDDSSDLSEPHFGDIENPIAMMKADHEQEGARFREISVLSDGYTPPKDACQTYQVAFKLLSDFESDLHKHVHLENNILFPKAVDAFKKVLA